MGSGFRIYLFDLGGATGIRTPDLLHAMQALYQLSYSPSAATAVRRWRPASVQELRGRWSQPTAFTRPHQRARSAVIAEHRLGQRACVVLQQPPAAPAPA